jgi:nucleoside-diphosphate-sugar epimerase
LLLVACPKKSVKWTEKSRISLEKGRSRLPYLESITFPSQASIMRVLLTGGSGFIASHILQQLLNDGHSVITTVRSDEKKDAIKRAYSGLGRERLDFAIVKDVAEEGAFDHAVISDPPFEAVIHTASPFHFNVTDIKKDLLDPAVNGTTGILRSIVQNAPTVRTVVVTSSWASVVNPFRGSWPEHTYNESDWNPISPIQALESIPNGYRASKTFAEKAAWEFMEREKPSFTLTTLCPPQVIGPVVHELSSLSNLNTSNQIVRDFIQGKFGKEVPSNGTFYWVDVRDIAKCHVVALNNPTAANRRYIVTAGRFSNQEIVGIIRSSFPKLEKSLPAKGAPGGGYPAEGLYDVDSSRVVKELKISWTGLGASIVDTVDSLQKLL